MESSVKETPSNLNGSYQNEQTNGQHESENDDEDYEFLNTMS